MNWLDIVLTVFLAVTTVSGLINGLVRSIIPLLGIIIGIVLAGRFYGSMGDWLSHWIKNPDHAQIAAFIIILILVILVALIPASALSKLLSSLQLGWIDRLGGAALGFIIGGFICGALLTLVAKYNVSDMNTTIQASIVASFFLDRFPLVVPFLPKEFNIARSLFH
jgi:membrane protein required for colicin V production